MTDEYGKCGSCGKSIIWLRHHKTLKANPIEADRAVNGNLVINRERGIYRFATKQELETARTENKKVYLSHFSTCPFAKEYRKNNVPKKAASA